MRFQPKPLNQQTIVITGATSGIGRATAQMACRRGARVVINARSDEECQEVADELRSEGGVVEFVAGDVADEATHERLADKAEEAFGGVDTWINNAGVSIYGRILETPVADMRRLFETNFWGVVHGSYTAAKRMGEQGGVLINIGSTVSDRAIPLQGVYAASKHAVKGFTSALRMEIEKDDMPIAVVLVKPGAINTLYPEHARNYMDREPSLPPPVYEPEVAARVILHCAEHPRRDAFVGGGGRMLSMMEKVAPRVGDHLMEWTLFDQSQRDEPAGWHEDALYEPTHAGRRGDIRARSWSATDTVARHPVATSAGGIAIAAAAAAGVAMLVRNGRR